MNTIGTSPTGEPNNSPSSPGGAIFGVPPIVDPPSPGGAIRFIDAPATDSPELSAISLFTEKAELLTAINGTKVEN